MRIFYVILMVCTVAVTPIRAQWAVFDFGNLTQGVVNSAREIIQTSATASNTLSSFQEAVKIYEQNKQYYDALKSVKNLVKDARKVQKTVLMVGEISEIYVTNFGRMAADPNYKTDELEMIAFGYSRILAESAEILEDLKVIITPSVLSMSDKERMDLIDRVHTEVTENRDLMNYFTRKSLAVSYIRSVKKNDSQNLRDFSGGTGRYW